MTTIHILMNIFHLLLQIENEKEDNFVKDKI